MKRQLGASKFSLQNNQTQGQNRPPRVPTPLDAYLLVDDIVCRGITKSAEYTGKKIGLSKRGVGSAFIVGSYVAGSAYDITALHSSHHHRIMAFFSECLLHPVLMGFAGFVALTVPWMKRDREEKTHDGTIARDPSLLQWLRLPFLVIQIDLVIKAWKEGSLTGLPTLAMSIVFFIASGSNGMLDRLSDWIKKTFSSGVKAFDSKPIQTDQ